MEKEIDPDLRREVIMEQRRRNWSRRCQCASDDLPGHCPGPENCPIATPLEIEE